MRRKRNAGRAVRRRLTTSIRALDFKEPGGPDDRWDWTTYATEERQMMSDQGVQRVVDDECGGRVIPGPDPGACPACGRWMKAGMVHTCVDDEYHSRDDG